MMANSTEEKKHWFRRVVVELQSPLVRYSRKITGNLESSREIVQDSFLKLWRERHEELVEHAKPWLYRVCRNASIDYKRREIGMEAFSEETMFSTESYPEDQVLKMEVYKRISQMSAKHREVLILKFQEGMSYKEISDVTGHSVSNVGHLIHHALKELKGQLSKEEVSNE